MIPEINVTALFGDVGPEREAVDQRIGEAACDVGFMSITGVPVGSDASAEVRESLLRLFAIPEAAQRQLWKKNFAPENANLYRGWFPLESGESKSREGFELGPDLVRELPDDGTDDLLYEPSVFPPDAMIPGWRADAARYYRAMETTGYAILASLSRSLGVPEPVFRDAFADGISTLRLLRYPGRDPAAPVPPEVEKFLTTFEDERFEIVCGAHVDSGLVTILGQCDVAGLQARTTDGTWLDVPPRPNGFVINFGGLLSRWTGAACAPRSTACCPRAASASRSRSSSNRARAP